MASVGALVGRCQAAQECEAVDVAEVLTLILCFPVAGLLLFALTVIEERLPDQSPGTSPSRQAGQEIGRSPAGRGTLIVWPADRARRKQSPARQAPAVDDQHRQAG
jgi:hypothetical protein